MKSTYTATYSPDDNKLRLYASTRLDSETYAKAKAAGFKWAPKQELFVAPAWTPGREDFLLTLVDEIDDEDTSLVDRAEERAERFGDYSKKRAKEADQAHAAVQSICDQIPLGQPILVGHHSEKRARKDAQRIENGMRRAVSLWETSEYWQRRAAGALAHAKYKESPEVRARRIKKIEADKRKQERNLAEAEKWLLLWSEPGLTYEKAVIIAGYCWLHLPRKAGDREDFDQNPSAHCALTNAHPTLYAPRTVEEVVEVAKRVYPRTIAHCKRWINHLDNRLAYEKAMLDEQGASSLIAPKARPKQLPLCNYRTPDGLQIENQYHKGEYIHYQPKEMTKAEYAKIYTDYKGTRVIDGTHRVRIAYVRGESYSRSFCVVFLTDQKEILPPEPVPPVPVEPVEVAEQRIQAKCLMIDEATLAQHGDFSPAQLAINRDQALIKYFSEHPEELEEHENNLAEHFDKWQRRNQPETPEPAEPADPEQPEVIRFEVGKTYWTRSICDHECIHRRTIASRTDKTIITTDGKRFKVSIWDGVEQFKPHGSYSMAAIISADKFEEQAEPVEVATEQEEAEALGFSTVEECQEHQEFVGQNQQRRQECTEAVEVSNGGTVAAPTWTPGDKNTKFDQMREQLKGGVQVVTAPQLFPTPHDLAARMVEEAEIEPGHRVLEPSAGTGNILKAIGDAPDKVAVELNQELAFSVLPRLGVSGLRIHQANFLECTEDQPELGGTFDRIVMNPPFENGADIKHIKHALTMLKPGGRLVAICANGPRQHAQLKPLAELWEPLPAGTFAQAGTMVNVALLVIEK